MIPKLPHRSLVFTAAVGGLAVFASPLLTAQTSGAGDTVLDIFRPAQLKGLGASAYASTVLDADLDSGGTGELGVFRAGGIVEYTKREARGPDFAKISLQYEHAQYDWSSTKWFEDVDAVSVVLTGYYGVGETDWGIFGFGRMRFAGADGADMFSGDSYSLVLGPTYSFSQDFTVTAGVGYFQRLEDDDDIIPFVGIDWKINEHWQLRTFNGASLFYDLNADKQTVFEFTAEWQSASFVLDQNTVEGNFVGSAVERSEATIILGVAHQFSDELFARIFFEGKFAREFDFRSNDNQVREIEVDSGFGGGFQIGYNF